jgi:hypothetical protein
MEMQFATNELSEPKAEIVTIQADNDSETLAIEPQMSSAAEAGRQFAKTAADIMANLPAYTTQLFQRYRSVFIALGWLFVALIALKLVGAVLGAINAILFGQSFLELIGLAYCVWFINRYLLTGSKRRELSQQIDRIKQQVLGEANS